MVNTPSFPNVYHWMPLIPVKEAVPKISIDRIFTSSLSCPRRANAVKEGFARSQYNRPPEELDLNDYLIQDPESTFYVRVSGNSMIRAGIHPGDLLIVNRSIKVQSGYIIVVMLENEMIVKRYIQAGDKKFLLPENPLYSAIEITQELNFSVCGVVTHLIHNFMVH